MSVIADSFSKLSMQCTLLTPGSNKGLSYLPEYAVTLQAAANPLVVICSDLLLSQEPRITLCCEIA